MSPKSQVIKLSTFFFILYTADTSNSTILSYIFETMKLPKIGPASLMAQYIFVSLSIIITAGIKLSLKKKMLIGALCYIVYYGLIIIAIITKDSSIISWLIPVGSAIDGIGAGLLWVSQGRYVHLICQIFDVTEIKGQIFGIFQLFYCLAMMCGAVVTLIAIGYFSVTVYFVLLMILATGAFFFNVFVVRDIDIIAEEVLQMYQAGSSEQNIKRIEDVSALLGKIKNEQYAEEYSIVQYLKGFVFFLPNMWPMVPVYFIEALTTGIRMNLLTHLIPVSFSEEQNKRIAGLCQIFAGVGSVVGGYLASYLTDLIGTVWVGRIILGLFSVNCWMYIVTINVQNVLLTYFTSFLWGFLLFCFVGLMMIIMSRHFLGKPEAFAVNRLTLALFMIGFQGAMIATDNSLDLLVFMIFSALPIFGILTLNWLPTMTNKEKQQSALL